MSDNVGVTIKLNSINELLRDRGLDAHGRVQKFIDSDTMRLMEPYMQLDTSQMIKSMYASTDVGSGEVKVETPYAHMRLHHGPTKGLRGPNYFERMKADRLDEILDGAAKLAGGEPEK